MTMDLTPEHLAAIEARAATLAVMATLACTVPATVVRSRAAVEQIGKRGVSVAEDVSALTAALRRAWEERERKRALLIERSDRIEALEAALSFYVDNVPAFRMKPIGEPDSPARLAQEAHIAAEDAARAALGRSA